MKTALALERALAFDMIVASRVLLLKRLGKEHPELPANLFYNQEELATLAGPPAITWTIYSTLIESGIRVFG